MHNNSEVKEKKFDFVKIIVKVLSFVLIIASLLTINFTTWFKVDGLKRKEAKEKIGIVENAIGFIERYSNREYSEKENTGGDTYAEYNDETEYSTNMDKLIDCGVFKSRRDMKTFFVKCENEVKKIYSCEYKLSDFCEIFKWCNELAGRVANAKSDEYVFENLEYIYLAGEDAEAINENSSTIKYGLLGVLMFSILIALLGIAAAIFNFKDKAKALKYIYAAFALILCIAAVVGTIAVNSTGAIYDFIASEEISLNITVWPFIAAIAAVAPCVIEHFLLKGKD